MLTTRMREYRKLAGITQTELAERCGCRRETIGKLEAGKYNPSLKLAMDIAHELHATVYDLFFFFDESGLAIEYDSSPKPLPDETRDDS